jgi:thiol-disulfide isomerase/thioredoxin
MFEEPHQVREWTMSREIGKPSPLGVLREETLMKLTLVPDPYPLDLPELPGPPKVGSPAPPLKVELFKEEKKLVSEKPRVLYFWATWCLPCKLALPELLAFGQQRSTEVIAITDEDADKLREFFQSFTDPFPETIAIDPLRVTFQSYGVSGTPTFVLVDGEGIVRHYQTGYAPEKGLGIEGWQWQNQLGKGQ